MIEKNTEEVDDELKLICSDIKNLKAFAKEEEDTTAITTPTEATKTSTEAITTSTEAITTPTEATTTTTEATTITTKAKDTTTTTAVFLDYNLTEWCNNENLPFHNGKYIQSKDNFNAKFTYSLVEILLIFIYLGPNFPNTYPINFDCTFIIKSFYLIYFF